MVQRDLICCDKMKEKKSISTKDQNLLFVSLVPLSTTVVRYLQGQINRIDLNDFQLSWNPISKRLILHSISSNVASIFQTIVPFLYPPSFVTLTTHDNTSTCLIDHKFQREIIITFTDGKLQSQEILFFSELFISKSDISGTS